MAEKLVDGPDPPAEVTPLRPQPKGVGMNGNLRPAPPWPKGVSGNPQRKGLDGRRRFSAQYLEDFARVWSEGGIEALRRVCREDPTSFVAAAGRLLSHDININTIVGIDPAGFVQTFRQAIELLGNNPEDLPRSRRMKVIEHDEVVDDE